MAGIGSYEVEWDREGRTITFQGRTEPGPHAILDEREVSDGNWFVAIQEPGRHYYSGQGAPFSYAPSEYVVLHVRSIKTSEREWFEAQKVLAWPARRPKVKEAKA